MNSARSHGSASPADTEAHIPLALADIVRLTKPYSPIPRRQTGGPYRFGIVAEIFSVLPTGQPRYMSL